MAPKKNRATASPFETTDGAKQMIGFPLEDQDELAAQLMQAVESLDVSKVRALLAGGVPADAWGISEDYDLPLQRVARFDGLEALEIARALIEAGAEIDHQGGVGAD